MTSVTKKETIQALLASPKVESVRVNECLTFVCSNKFISHIKEFEYDIESFTPKYVETEVFEVGDVVWFKGRVCKIINVFSDVLEIDSGAGFFIVEESDLILIKKADGDSDD